MAYQLNAGAHQSTFNVLRIQQRDPNAVQLTKQSSSNTTNLIRALPLFDLN